jgi:hypothetical protein
MFYSREHAYALTKIKVFTQPIPPGMVMAVGLSKDSVASSGSELAHSGPAMRVSVRSFSLPIN